jgi:two-component system, NtrC family, sensor kinase
MSLQRALFALIAFALLVGLLPAALAVDRRLAKELELQTRQELAVAPRLLKERRAALSDALMMHAKDLAGTSDLTAALASGQPSRAARALEGVNALGRQAVLVGPDGKSWSGMTPPRAALDATRRGEMPVIVVPSEKDSTLITLALAPVKQNGKWIGAAGLAVQMDKAEAETLAGLTSSQVVIVGPRGTTTAGPIPEQLLSEVIAAARPLSPSDSITELRLGEDRFLAIAAPLDSARVIFVRDMAHELALVPQIRRVVGTYAGVALIVALALGVVFAGFIARPVRSLAAAAARLAAGDFNAPLMTSRITEVSRVSGAFDAMRRALAARLADLQDANRELENRQQRLVALQAELIQRDRLAAAGRLVAQLAHEIRNPVANVRNCLEIVRRRVADDPEGSRFADLAIDELLRMHELAEQMLDLHRPRDQELTMCDAVEVAHAVAALMQAGTNNQLRVFVSGRQPAPTVIPPDALKQVLLNIAQNAREAMDGSGSIELRIVAGPPTTIIDVLDSGPGIASDILPNIFDPFFTTKRAVHGVGLGLFVAEGIIRSQGGEIIASNRAEGGARFRISLPSVAKQSTSGVTQAERAGAESTL